MAIRAGNLEFDNIEDVQKAMDAGLIQKHDVVGTSPNMQPPHGLWYNNPNVAGLFTRPGAEPDMYGTVVMPTGLSFLSRLLRGVTIYRNPEFDVLSGVNALVGSTAANVCAPGPKAGTAKLCTLRSAFGEFKIETDQGSLAQMGGRINNSDVDRRLVNMLMNIPFVPDPLRLANNINTPLGLAYYRLTVSMIREMLGVLFTGNFGTASGMWIKQFNGFDQLLIENPIDVEGNVCAAASSIVYNWGNRDVAGANGEDNLVDIISGICHHLQRLSDDTALPSTWEIVMDNDMFFALTQVWPCSYITNGCAVSGNDRQVVDATQQIAMRDEMRSGSFLWVNGRRYSVTLTTAISKTAVGAGFSAPIYIIPMTAMGEQVTYLEGFDKNNADIRQFVAAGAYTHYRAFNGGLYAMTERQSDFCIEHVFTGELRLITRTPWLGARIENVNYRMPGFLYSRDYRPGGTYYENGGRYFNSPPYYNPNSI